MGIPATYDDAAFARDFLYRFVMSRMDRGFGATDDDSASSGSSRASDAASCYSDTDSFVGTTTPAPAQPAAHPVLQTAAKPAAAALRAAKWSLKRLVGGKSRAEAKGRLLAVQTEILQYAQSAEEVRRHHHAHRTTYRAMQRQHGLLRGETAITLQMRERTVSIMHRMDRFDAELLKAYRDVHAHYTSLYKQNIAAQQAMDAAWRTLRGFVGDFANIRAQVRPLLEAYGEDQEAYVAQYGRLPHGVSSFANLRAMFAHLPDVATEPTEADLPPPETLTPPPALFAGKTRPQAKPRPTQGRTPPPPPATEPALPTMVAGLQAAQRLGPYLAQIYSGDSSAWRHIRLADLEIMQPALAQSAVRHTVLDPASQRNQRAIARICLGNPDDSQVRQSYRRCQMIVHPDKTASLPAATRAKADALCKLVGAALAVLAP